MAWALEYAPAAKKELEKLDKAVQRELKKYMAEVCKLADPASRGHSLGGPWARFHRYKLGQIRVIVDVQRSVLTIMVIKIGRRDSVY